MRIAGIVLLVLAALLVVPPLTLAAWIAIREPRADEYGMLRLLLYKVAILGGCIGALGGLAVWVGRKPEPPRR